jgi:hypothetical protein
MPQNWDLNDRRLTSLLLIGGGLLLLGFWQYGIGVVWPLFIVGPGLIFLYHATTGTSRESADMIFPGVILTATGGLLLYQSITGHWESWAYAWAMYPAAAGYAMQWRAARVSAFRHEYVIGRNMLRYGLMALIGMAVIFEFAIFRSGSAQMLGIGLVLIGLVTLVSNNKRSPRETDFGDLLKRKNDSKAKFEDVA